MHDNNFETKTTKFYMESILEARIKVNNSTLNSLNSAGIIILLCSESILLMLEVNISY